MKFLTTWIFAVAFLVIGCQSESVKPESAADTYLKAKAAREAENKAEYEETMNLKVQACLKEIEACDVQLKDLQQYNRCYQRIESACPVPGINQVTEDRRIALMDKITSLESSLNPREILRGKYCESGFRWSYSITTTPKSCPQCYVVASEYRKNIKGEFTEKDKCEEARILADENSKFKMSGSCFHRYTGESKKIHLWMAKAMIREGSTQTNEKSMNLFFLNPEKCEQALTNGLDFFRDKFSKEIPIAAAGTEAKNRFVGKCTKVEHLLCAKNSEDIEKLPLHIL